MGKNDRRGSTVVARRKTEKAQPFASADARPRVWMRENDGCIEWKRDATEPWKGGCNSMYDALCMGTEDAAGLEQADFPAVIIWEGSTNPV